MDDTEKALNYYETGAKQSGKGPCPKPEWIPKRVRLKGTVKGDFIFSDSKAGPGEFDAEVNGYGAVSVRADDGKLLGLRLHEFEVIEWTENPKFERP